MKSTRIESVQAWIRYLDLAGREPARVFLHGLLKASSSDFPAVASHPALWGHRSVLIDLFGFGFSDRPRSFRYTMEDHAATVAAVLDDLGLKNCAVVGHSMGGAVGICLAVQRPDLVARLISAEGNLEPDAGDTTFSGPIAAQTEEEFLHRGQQAVLQLPGSASFRGVRQIADPYAIYRSSVSLVAPTRPTFGDRLTSLSMPRYYLFGEKTLATDNYMAARAEVLPPLGVRVLVVPGVLHGMGVHEDPTPFAETLRTAFTE